MCEIFTPRRHLTVEEAREMLPEIGDELMLSRSFEKEIFGHAAPPRSCVVVYVNRPHRWFRVRFHGCGTYECYKVPDRQKLGTEGGVPCQK